MATGWIKLRRSLIDWEWYSDHNATRLLIHLLISVNYEEKKWRGITIRPGQIITSWESLSKSSGLTIRQCRTAMKKLENSQEVTREATNKFQLLTLLKWEKMQVLDSVNGMQVDNQMTGKRQASDKQATTTKEDKEIKEIKEPLYGKSEFFKDWNEQRKKHLKKPSFLNTFGNWESENAFNTLKKDHTRDEIRKAMIGLFKQQVLPNGQTSMQSNPKHFLTHFNAYLTAYHDQNTELYGKCL